VEFSEAVADSEHTQGEQADLVGPGHSCRVAEVVVPENSDLMATEKAVLPIISEYGEMISRNWWVVDWDDS